MRTSLITVLVIRLLAAAAHAQPPPNPVPDYVVGLEDVLSITVFNEPTLTGRFTVESDGHITFPLLGRVPVAAKTLRAIQDDLIRRLGADLLVNPQVTVVVDQFRSQSVFVVGEVRQSGKHTITGIMTLLEALSKAGGTTESAGNEVIVRRPKDPASRAAAVDPADDSRSDVIARVKLDDLQSGRAANATIRDGDTVYVPAAQKFFVNGHVRTPGAYRWEEGMTVLKALSMAGGVTERGARNRVKIIRIVKGYQVRIDVQLTDLVRPNDTIEVPQRYF